MARRRTFYLLVRIRFGNLGHLVQNVLLKALAEVLQHVQQLLQRNVPVPLYIEHGKRFCNVLFARAILRCHEACCQKGILTNLEAMALNMLRSTELWPFRRSCYLRFSLCASRALRAILADRREVQGSEEQSQMFQPDIGQTLSSACEGAFPSVRRASPTMPTGSGPPEDLGHFEIEVKPNK